MFNQEKERRKVRESSGRESERKKDRVIHSRLQIEEK